MANTTTCKDCGKEVSNEAQKCPHCGANGPAFKPIPVSGMILVIVAPLIGVFLAALLGLY